MGVIRWLHVWRAWPKWVHGVHMGGFATSGMALLAGFDILPWWVSITAACVVLLTGGVMVYITLDNERAHDTSPLDDEP